MLVLAPTTDKIQLLSFETGDLDVVAAYVDRDTTTFVAEGAVPQYTNITTVATTDIIAAPAAGKARNVKEICIRNVHATAWATPKVVVDVSGVDYELIQAVLRPGDALQYVDGKWTVLPITALPMMRTFRLQEDHTNSGVGTSSVQGQHSPLSCPLPKIGTYYNFTAHLHHVSNATTTGAWFGFQFTGNDDDPSLIATIDTVTTSVGASIHSAGAGTARNVAATAQITGSVNQCLAIITGATRPLAVGVLGILSSPEVVAANGLIVKAGSWLRVWEPTS